jgi:hypothetical protein
MEPLVRMLSQYKVAIEYFEALAKRLAQEIALVWPDGA